MILNCFKRRTEDSDTEEESDKNSESDTFLSPDECMHPSIYKIFS